MAVTKIIPVRSTIEKSIDYICNPAKTDGGFFVHSEHCAPQTAALEFQNLLRQSRAGGNTIGRHLIQSFAPGEVDPATAHEIGIKLADEILKGKYAYVMATHVDRGHIHNHFVWCAADVVDHKRYRSNKNTYHEIRETSDRLCKDNSLSVIIPHGVGMGYTEYNAAKQGTSWKAKLRSGIDAVISRSVTFEDFLKRMEFLGCEIKRGKYISFRAPGQERFTRAKTLGDDYTEEALKKKIADRAAAKSEVQPGPELISAPVVPPIASSTLPAAPPAPTPTVKPPAQKIIDTAASEKAQQSEAYAFWAKLHNLKVTAETVRLVQQYGGLDALDDYFRQCIADKLTLDQSVKADDARIQQLATLRRTVNIYHSTKTVYDQYRVAPDREKFYQQHTTDIKAHRAAREALKQVKPPIPSVKSIDAEAKKLMASKAEASALARQKKTEIQQLATIRSNLYSIIPPNRHKQQSRNNDFDL